MLPWTNASHGNDFRRLVSVFFAGSFVRNNILNTPKNPCLNQTTQKNPGIENFKPLKNPSIIPVTRLLLSLEIPKYPPWEEIINKVIGHHTSNEGSVFFWFQSKERPRNGIFGFGRAKNATRVKK